MERLGPYELVERLGQGGMAEVFLARRQAEGVEKRLVIKRILPDFAEMSDFVQMFINEARVAAMLEHPNITQLLDFGQVDGRFILAIEYVQGTDFSALIHAAAEAGEQLPEEVVLKVCALTGEALAYAHALTDERGELLGFIHRDVSPDNILLGSNGAVKVSDFGIAKLRTLPKVTKTGTLKGKPAYAAPEYLRGKGITPVSDLFSLGVVLFEGLTGRKPFEGADLMATMRAVVMSPTPDVRALRPELSDATVAVLNRALQKDPAKRYADAAEMVAELEGALQALRRPATGRVIANLVARYLPARRSGPSMAAQQTGTEPTHMSLKSDPRAEAPAFGTDDTRISKNGLPPAPAERRPTRAKAGSDDAPATELDVDAMPAARRSTSRWASAPQQASDTEPATIDPVVAAHQRAFELADEKLSDADEHRRLPGREGTKRRVPLAALVGGMALCGAVAVGFVVLAPHQKALVQHVDIQKTADKQLEVTANVATADVFVNGSMIGHTPMKVDNAYPFGQRVELTVRALGFDPVDAQIIGGVGQQVQVTFAQAPDE